MKIYYYKLDRVLVERARLPSPPLLSYHSGGILPVNQNRGSGVFMLMIDKAILDTSQHFFRENLALNNLIE